MKLTIEILIISVKKQLKYIVSIYLSYLHHYVYKQWVIYDINIIQHEQ